MAARDADLRDCQGGIVRPRHVIPIGRKAVGRIKWVLHWLRERMGKARHCTFDGVVAPCQVPGGATARHQTATKDSFFRSVCAVYRIERACSRPYYGPASFIGVAFPAPRLAPKASS